MAASAVAALSIRGIANGIVRSVDVSYHGAGDEIPVGTLEAMIRQSGLDKRLFRK